MSESTMCSSGVCNTNTATSREYRHVSTIDMPDDDVQRWKVGDTGIVLYDPSRPAEVAWLGSDAGAAQKPACFAVVNRPLSLGLQGYGSGSEAAFGFLAILGPVNSYCQTASPLVDRQPARVFLRNGGVGTLFRLHNRS
jgi:hypothetical protein